jgi:hypothetical protein
MPPPSSSPTPSTSSTSWWSAAKNKLTPTKDLTPAQQVILDVKRTEKEREKAEKEYLKKSNKGSMPPKDPTTTEEWPAAGETKYTDPAFLNLTPNPSPGRVPAPSKGSPSFTAPNLTPSPNRNNRISNNAAGGSPGIEQPPIYAQFNGQGGLDVHLTLISIAKRYVHW